MFGKEDRPQTINVFCQRYITKKKSKMLYDYDGRPLSFNENVVDFLKKLYESKGVL